jgi:hypothetical protein
MPQPRLLLIDDEPSLAEFLANAARETGLSPSSPPKTGNFATNSCVIGRIWSRSTSACLEWTGSSSCAFSPSRIFGRRSDRQRIRPPSLESAFRLGEALGLTMADRSKNRFGLEQLETLLNELKASLDG